MGNKALTATTPTTSETGSDQDVSRQAAIAPRRRGPAENAWGYPYRMGKRRLPALGAMDADGVATQAGSRTCSSGTSVKGTPFIWKERPD